MPPIIMHTSAPPQELIRVAAEARGLSMDEIPQAVQITISSLQEAIVGPLYRLIAELPPEAKGFEWMAVTFAGFAEFADHTIVANHTAVPGDGSGDGSGSTPE